MDIVCPEDTAVYNCNIDYGTVIEWQVSSTSESGDLRESFSRNQHVGHTRDTTLCSTTLMFTVTSLTSSSIGVTLTIHTPVLLNGTTISCEGKLRHCMYCLVSHFLQFQILHVIIHNYL